MRKTQYLRDVDFSIIMSRNASTALFREKQQDTCTDFSKDIRWFVRRKNPRTSGRTWLQNFISGILRWRIYKIFTKFSAFLCPAEKPEDILWFVRRKNPRTKLWREKQKAPTLYYREPGLCMQRRTLPGDTIKV